MSDLEIMQMALKQLESHMGIIQVPSNFEAIEALRARLAQLEHEAVEKTMLDVWQDVGDPRFPSIKPEPQEAIAKWIKTNTEHREWYICPKCKHQTPRFKDEWQGLTDEEAKEAWKQLQYDLTHGKFAADDMERHVIVEFYKAIEAKLKEKNVLTKREEQ